MHQIFLFFIILIILFHKIVNDETNSNQPEEYLMNDVKCTSFCSSPDCSYEVSYVIRYVDKNVDPCDDFYQFACGKMIRHSKGLEDFSETLYTAFELYTQMTNELKSEISAIDLMVVKKMKMYYKNCLDEGEIEKIGTEPLVKLLRMFGGWPILLEDDWEEKNYHWKEVMSKISREGFDPDFPIKLSLGYDPTNSQNYLLHVTPPETNFNSATDEKSIEGYKSYLVEVAVLLGANREKAVEEIDDCVAFEEKLYKTQSSPIDLSEVSPIESRMTISDLSNKYPEFPWLDVINRILNPSNVSVTTNEFLIAKDATFFSKIGQIMKNTPQRTIANYQILRIVDNLVEYMPEKLRTLSKIKNNSNNSESRDFFCYSTVKKAFGMAFSFLYIKKYFNAQSRDKIGAMIQKIQQEAQANLKSIKWIDGRTREEALGKLEAMKVVVAYPDELLDDKEVEKYYEDLQVEIVSGKFFNNAQEISTKARNFVFKLLHNPVAEIEPRDMVDFNLYYLYEKNKVVTLAGVLQRPFFELNRPDNVNYGSIGTMIGHEITHGFDNIGRSYDRYGNYRNWWTNESAKVFEDKVQCMIDQYNNYTVKQINQSVNGKLTIAENIADAGGIKLAYRAYQNSLRNKDTGNQCLRGIDYTSNQIFWISAANSECAAFTDQRLRESMATDTHSPNEARVNVPFSNSDDFARDFECPIGSRMNPVTKCEVW